MKLPLQNRVTPFGDIIATAARCALTGNRGTIHDPDSRRLLPKRRWSSKAWIYCRCDFQNRKRDVFGRNSPNGGAGWTNLFFLDEATALAAGHRPCFFCQRERANEFRDAWMCANGPWPGVQLVDRTLHEERILCGQKRTHPLPEKLPDGVVVGIIKDAFRLHEGRWFKWLPEGYIASADLDRADLRLLTPPSIVKVISAGFTPKPPDTMRLGGTG
ncbi:MAG: hypothetical protein AAFR71_02990 [Pseudomonadota bacterium]